MRDSINRFNVFLIVFAICVSIFFILIPFYQADRLFIEAEYRGIIRAIEYKSGNRGLPDILIDTTWRGLSVDESKIRDHIAVGDSIVKKNGRVIELYEKENGQYKLKVRI